MLELVCKAIGHRHARRVWHDGIDFRARCVRCGGEMVRDGVQGSWRLFDPAGDASPFRVEKPVHPSRAG